MPEIEGLIGLRPADSLAAQIIATPPYDVIYPEGDLERFLKSKEYSIHDVILGSSPIESLERLFVKGKLIEDNEPSFYVYSQKWINHAGSAGERLGVFAAVEVSDPKKGKIRDHEDTFEDKVKGRIKLAHEIGYTTGPVFCIAQSNLTETLKDMISQHDPLFQFTSDFSSNGSILSDMHGIENTIFRISQESDMGRLIQASLDTNLYIADGHHRYAAALKSGQTHFFAYATDNSGILSYNRLINSNRSFENIICGLRKKGLTVTAAEKFKTPDEKGTCCVYTKNGIYDVRFNNIPENDVVGSLDVSLLKRDFFPLLGIDGKKIKDGKSLHYLPETLLEEMKMLVNQKKYGMAVAMRQALIEDVIAVADARYRRLAENGVPDKNLTMPPKSTYFYPKILTGLFLYKHIIRN